MADPYLFVLTRWARAKGVDLHNLDGVGRHFDVLYADLQVHESLSEEGLASTDEAAKPEQ